MECNSRVTLFTPAVSYFIVPKVLTQGESIFSYLNSSEVVQKAMGTNKAEVKTIDEDENKIINIYLNILCML